MRTELERLVRVWHVVSLLSSLILTYRVAAASLLSRHHIYMYVSRTPPAFIQKHLNLVPTYATPPVVQGNNTRNISYRVHAQKGI
uniref:Putative secreted protein n=1 Tax=Ixodes ricinus TaxID=34613 RepID=A0A6B0TY67_IXORI